MNINDIKIGDKVRLVKCHSAHNQNLRDMLGRVGIITTIGEGFASEEVHVNFNESNWWDHYWVNVRYLEPAGD